MKRWDLHAEAEGDRRGPRALFSTPEARGVVVDLDRGEEMSDHQVRERAIVQVLRGQVTIQADDEAADCGEGTLVVLEPGESHAVRAVEPARLLIMLAPWPAPDHYSEKERQHDPHELPVNASQSPLGDRAA